MKPIDVNLELAKDLENMMKTITETELKNALDSYLEEVKKGETLIITKGGEEICEIHPRIVSKLALFDSLTGIAAGAKVAFIDGEDGNVYVVNASLLSLKKAQEAFSSFGAGAFESEEDAMAFAVETRKGKR